MPQSRLLFRASSVVLVGLVACGGGSKGASGTPDGGDAAGAGADTDGHAPAGDDARPSADDPFQPESLAAALAGAYCRYRARCQPVYAAYVPETPDACEATVRASTTAQWSELEPLITAGRVAFRRAELDDA